MEFQRVPVEMFWNLKDILEVHLYFLKIPIDISRIPQEFREFLNLFEIPQEIQTIRWAGCGNIRA